MLCRLFKNSHICLLYGAAVLLLGIHPREIKAYSIKKKKKDLHADVHSIFNLKSKTVSNPRAHRQVDG